MPQAAFSSGILIPAHFALAMCDSVHRILGSLGFCDLVGTTCIGSFQPESEAMVWAGFKEASGDMLWDVSGKPLCQWAIL
jgi:hypothetical protein